MKKKQQKIRRQNRRKQDQTKRKELFSSSFFGLTIIAPYSKIAFFSFPLISLQAAVCRLPQNFLVSEENFLGKSGYFISQFLYNRTSAKDKVCLLSLFRFVFFVSMVSLVLVWIWSLFLPCPSFCFLFSFFVLSCLFFFVLVCFFLLFFIF